jgi:phosphoglucosamine mutase
VLEALRRASRSLAQALQGLKMLPQQTINVRLHSAARPVVEAAAVQSALAEAQAAVSGRGRAFLRPSGTEPVVRVTVEADDDALMRSVLEKLAAAVRAAAE